MKQLRFLAACLFIHCGLVAQNIVEDAAEPLRDLKLSTYARGSASYSGLFFEAEPEQFRPLRVLRGSRAAPVSYRGPSDFSIFRRVATEDPEKPWRYYPVASTVIQDGQNEYMLLITPRRTNDNGNRSETEFNIAVLPQMHHAVENQHVVFYNGTSVQLLGILGEERITLDPGLSRAYPITDFPQNEGVLVGLTVRYEDSLRPVFHNHLNFSNQSRYIIVLLPPEKQNSFELVAFRLAI